MANCRLGRWDESGDPDSWIKSRDTLTGGKSGYTRSYLDVDDDWDGSLVRWGFQHDRIPVIAWHAWTRARNAIQWAAIAAGDHDGAIRRAANSLKSLGGRGVPAYIIFHHEPENEENGKTSGDISGHCGTRAEFKQAAAHFFQVVRSIIPNQSDALMGITLMAGSYKGTSPTYSQWTPPTYELLGIDGYSKGSTADTFNVIVGGAHTAATKVGKSLFIQEIGCKEIPGTTPAFKPQFFNDMRTKAKEWTNLKGICYSNVVAKADYRIDTTTASLNAYKVMSGDAYFKSDQYGTWT